MKIRFLIITMVLLLAHPFNNLQATNNVTNSNLLTARPTVFFNLANLEKYVLASNQGWHEFLNQTVQSIAKNIAKQHGAIAAIPYSSDMNKCSWINVFIIDPAYDITSEVIDALNKKYS